MVPITRRFRAPMPRAMPTPSTAPTSVWVVEKGAVQLRKVEVAGQSGNDILLSGGVQPGQTVVTAGVHLLKPGQKVRILTGDVARRGDTEAAAVGGGSDAANSGAGK